MYRKTASATQRDTSAKDRKIFLTDSRYFEMAQESNSQGGEFELDIVGRYDLKDKLNEIFSSSYLFFIFS